MSRRIRATIVVMVCTAVLVSLGGPVAASIERRYAGETSQGYGIGARVQVRDGLFRLEALSVRRITLTCDDHSTQSWGFGFRWAGRGLRLPDRRLAMDEVNQREALHLHGRFWPGRARGTLSLTVPALTSEEEAMICTSGQLDWEMQRTSPNPISSLHASRLNGVIRVRVTEEGDVRTRTRQL